MTSNGEEFFAFPFSRSQLNLDGSEDGIGLVVLIPKSDGGDCGGEYGAVPYISLLKWMLLVSNSTPLSFTEETQKIVQPIKHKIMLALGVPTNVTKRSVRKNES